MDKMEYIEKILLKSGVRQYKIIKKTEKGLGYKEIFKKISCEKVEYAFITVIFNVLQDTVKIIISENETNSMIESYLKNAIQNTACKEFIDNTYCENRQNKTYKCFCDFSFDAYEVWLKNEFEKIKSKTNMSLNFFYKLNLYEHVLITNVVRNSRQYRMESECLCAENTAFQKISNANNIFINNNLSDRIITDLNKTILFLQAKFDSEKNYLVEPKALAQILNEYVKFFYANNIYLKQSFIKISDIGKQIVNSRIGLIAVPYEQVLFDGEGLATKEKVIIKDGKLVNIFSDISHSRYLGIRSFGNHDCYKTNSVSHQRLIFQIKNKINSNNKVKIKTSLKYFESLYINCNDKTLNGIAIYEKNSDVYRTDFCLYIHDIFDNIYASEDCLEKGKWFENVYCKTVLVQKM